MIERPYPFGQERGVSLGISGSFDWKDKKDRLFLWFSFLYMSMACFLKTPFIVSWANDNLVKNRPNLCGSSCCMRLKDDFMGKSINVSSVHKGLSDWNAKAPSNFSVHAQTSICVSRAMRWWEKTLKPNMVEIHSGQELIDSLSNAGDRLVIIDFYSPGCGGCRALHPKICQLAESKPDAMFLKVNYEELKKMCHSLHIHVLPFFRFYRGAEGKLCSFSCTNATIKKFKDALAKYGSDRCSIGPAKGLDESELLSLASVGEISINSPFLPTTTTTRGDKMEDLVPIGMDVSELLGNKTGTKEGSKLMLA